MNLSRGILSPHQLPRQIVRNVLKKVLGRLEINPKTRTYFYRGCSKNAEKTQMRVSHKSHRAFSIIRNSAGEAPSRILRLLRTDFTTTCRIFHKLLVESFTNFLSSFKLLWYKDDGEASLPVRWEVFPIWRGVGAIRRP